MGVWGTLIWKEWLGLRWKVAALCAIPAALLLFGLLYDRHDIAGSYVTAIMACGGIAPIFLAMHAAAAERADGTIEFVSSLPCSRRQAGLIRVLAGLSALLTPILVTGLFAWIILEVAKVPQLAMRGSDRQVMIFGAPAAALVFAASTYLWTTALAMNQPTELRAGAIGVATLVVWLMVSFSCFAILARSGLPQDDSLERWTAHPGLWGILFAGPMCVIGLADVHRAIPLAVYVFAAALQVVTSCVLVWFALERYANTEPRWSKFRLSGRTGALVWAQAHQIVPLCVLGLLTAIPFLVVGPVGDDPFFLMIFIGSIWALVAGVTLFTSELEPRLLAFWRSRPIDASQWFRVKYAAGALVVLVCFDLPVAFVGRSSPPMVSTRLAGFLAYLTCGSILHLAVYSVAVLAACYVRQAVYAGILSLSAIAFLVILPHRFLVSGRLQALDAGRIAMNLSARISGSMLPPNEPSLWIYLTVTGLVLAVGTVAAWCSVRYDVAAHA